MSTAFDSIINKATRATKRLLGSAFERAQLPRIAVNIKQAWEHQVDEAAFLASYAAYAARENTKEKLFDAALSYKGQFFIDYAGFATSAFNAGANFSLLTIFPHAAIAFFLQEPGWWLNNVNEKMKKGEWSAAGIFPGSPRAQCGLEFAARHGKKWGGALAIIGSCVFLHDAFEPSWPWAMMAVSSLPDMVQSSTAIFENRYHGLAPRLDASGHPIAARMTEYAMSSSTVVDVLSMALFTVAAHYTQNADILTPTALLLIGGDVGLFCQDDNFLRRIREEKARRDAQLSDKNFLTYARHGVTVLPMPA